MNYLSKRGVKITCNTFRLVKPSYLTIDKQYKVVIEKSPGGPINGYNLVYAGFK